MRKVWICTLLVPFVLSLTTSEAAQEPEQSGFQVVSTDAEYLGPIPSDAVIAERRAQSGGSLDVYNVWTSFKRPRLRPNLQITGHSYQICTDRFNAVWFATLVFNRANNISGDVPAAVEFGRVAAAPVNTLRQQTHRCQEISVCF